MCSLLDSFLIGVFTICLLTKSIGVSVTHRFIQSDTSHLSLHILDVVVSGADRDENLAGAGMTQIWPGPGFGRSGNLAGAGTFAM